MQADNIFDLIPGDTSAEIFETLVATPSIRIERIISHGHKSPEHGWYDQTEHEWVMVLEGGAILEFADGTLVNLTRGDYINIAARVRHKVSWTDPACITLWLAVFYS